MRRLRSATVYLALAALVLRAIVPVGWMASANAATPAAYVPCPMMDGMAGMAMPKHKAEPQHPPKHQLPASHEGSICAFATSTPVVRATEPQRIEIAPAHFVFFGPAGTVLAPAWDHAPRAPPAIG